MDSENKLVLNKEFDIQVLLTVIKRSWFWIPFIVAFFITGAFLYLRYTKPVFESNALLQVVSEDQGESVLNIKNVNAKPSISKEIQLLKSEFILKSGIEKLDLKVSHYAQGEFLTEERYGKNSFLVHPVKLTDSSLFNSNIHVKSSGDQISLSYFNDGKQKKYKINPGELLTNEDFSIIIEVDDWNQFLIDSEKNQLYFHFNDIQMLTAKLASGLDVRPVNIEARTIEVSYQSNNALLSKDIVQAVINSFMRYDEQLKKESANNILGFIKTQLDSLNRELKNSKDSIMYFQRRENIPDPESYSSSLASNIDKFSSQLYVLLEEQSNLSEIEYKLKNNPNHIEVFKMIPVITGKSFEGAIFDRINQLEELLEKKENYLLNLTPESKTIERLEQKIDATIENITKTLHFIKNRTDEKIAFVRQEINKIEKAYYDLPEKKMELTRLRNLQQLNEKYFTLFTEKQVQYSISNAGYTAQNKILKSPVVSDVPVSPKRNMIYLSAGFLSILISLGLLFIRYIRFNEINQLKDLEKLMPHRVGVLGEVPFTKTKMDFSQLVVSKESKSFLAESLRTIRTNLSFINKDAQLIAISSSISGEGKTFVALNLAGVLAMSGKKILLIDLDLRKPKVHLGLDADNTLGMSNLLVDQCTIDEVVKHSKIEGFDFITAGPIPPNPSELILGDNFKNTIEKLKKHYDKIIIDTPPVGLVSDGISILSEVDIPIYVFKANYSKRQFVSNIYNLTKKEKISNLNVILNGVKKNKKSYGYGYHGYYIDEVNNRKSIFNRLFKKWK